MTSKNITIFAILVVVIGLGAYFFNNSNPPEKISTSNYNPQTQGKVVFGVADAAGDMQGVSSVVVTVDKVEVHSAANGWVTVSTTTKDYDLLLLKQSGAVSLLANANLDVGTYDQVRLMISKVVVTKNGVSQEAKLPSGELKLVGSVVVNADKTSSVVFDFLTDKSLHVTGKGKFIFAPVIKVKKQNDTKVELKSDDEVVITGGRHENDEDFGMDEKGDVKSNFELKGNLSIDENDDIQGEYNDQNENKDEGNSETNNDLVFNFSAQNNSGLSGTATLSGGDGKVKVTLKLTSSLLGLLSTAQPAHIHLGSCPNVGAVKYPLNSVVNGKSETTLNVSLAQLKTELPLAINVHKSAAEINVYTACTDLSL